jgi:AhpD family alkylhydroperoxidase
MQPRMQNPATLVPGAMDAVIALARSVRPGVLPDATLELVHLRASQINGCSSCVAAGSRSAKKAGESDERLWAVAAWRDATCYTPAERAALALTEAVTRLSDRTDPVPDAIWDEAAAHYDQTELAALVVQIAVTNVFNRMNVPTRQIPGDWG